MLYGAFSFTSKLGNKREVEYYSRNVVPETSTVNYDILGYSGIYWDPLHSLPSVSTFMLQKLNHLKCSQLLTSDQ